MASAWQPLGDAALWAPRPRGTGMGSETDGLALGTRLRACEGVVDAVVTEDRVCVYFEPGAVPRDLDRALERGVGGASATPREVIVRVSYDGPDLALVASLSGLPAEDVIRLHAAGVYVVRMVGFLPGFAYLGGLEPRLVVARRSVPRPRVDAGSVAIAADYTAVYPFASPGGWNVIGHAQGAEMFRSDTGALLRLGDRVRFERVG